MIKIPEYEGLRVKQLFKFDKSKLSTLQYFPNCEYSKESDREWIRNIINFLIPKVELRSEELIQNQNFGICIKSEFEELFRKSQTVSMMKGKLIF